MVDKGTKQTILNKIRTDETFMFMTMKAQTRRDSFLPMVV